MKMSEFVWWQLHQRTGVGEKSKNGECTPRIVNHLIICIMSFPLVRFASKQNQSRRSVVLKNNQGVLAYPQCLRGNLPLLDETVDAVVQFYCEDGISRVSSNAKDTILINKQRVPVRFMEMTVLDAYRIFNERHPGAIARSTFNSLRPREVKIASPHETCMCIIHENMNLLLKVHVFYWCYRFVFNSWFRNRLGTTFVKSRSTEVLQETMKISIWGISYPRWLARLRMSIALVAHVKIVQKKQSSILSSAIVSSIWMMNAHGHCGRR